MNQNSVKTEIKEGSHDEFIHFLFGQEPKEKDSIQLEIPDIPKDKNIHLHIYEQLLQIFVDGLKYFYSNDEGKVDVTKLNEEDIKKIQKYFESMNFLSQVEVFDLNNYKFKFPDYFKNRDTIKSNTVLNEFFYEVQGSDQKMYRITFDYL